MSILKVLSFFALQQRVAAGSDAVKANQKLFDHLVEQSSDNGSLDELMLFNPVDLIFRVLIEENLVDGYIGDTAPTNPSVGKLWLKRATLATAPMINQPEIKQFDGTNWVAPNYELTYKAIADKIKSWDTSCTFDPRPNFVNYHDPTEGYLVGQWVKKNGWFSMSKTGTATALNYVDPDLANVAVREQNWKYHLSESEFCEATSSSLSSLISALFDFVGKDEVYTGIVVDDIKKAIADLMLSGIKTWANGDSHNNGNSIVKGSDGKLYLANPAGNPAGNDPVAAGSVPNHWYGSFDSLAQLLAFSLANDPSKAGLKQWAMGDGLTPNTRVVIRNGMLFVANPTGTPNLKDPAAAGSVPSHWYGGYPSVGSAFSNLGGLSRDSGNLLQLRDDGIYYGIEPPNHLRALYLSNGGTDEITDAVGYRGTRNKPLRTLQYALSLLSDGMSSTLYLHEGHTFNVYAENPAIAKGAINLRIYGTNQDTLDNTWADRSVWSASAASTAIHPKIVAHDHVVPGAGIKIAPAFYPNGNGSIQSIGIDYETAASPNASYPYPEWRGSFSNPDYKAQSFQIMDGKITVRGANVFGSSPSANRNYRLIALIEKVGDGFVLDCNSFAGTTLTRNSREGQPIYFQTTSLAAFDAGGYIINYDSAAPTYNYLLTNANLPAV